MTQPLQPRRPRALAATLARYGFAALAVCAAAGVRFALEPWIETDNSPFIVFTPAVMASAWLWGVGPGLFATILGALIGDFFWVEPLYTVRVTRPSEGVDTALFVVTGTILSLMSRALARARADAQDANRAKDRFLAVLSHELRNPLNAATAALASLEQVEPTLPEQARHDLAIVRRNTHLQTRLIEDLLDVSRIATGKLTLRPQPCDAHELINHTLEACQPEAAAKNLTLTADCRAHNRQLNADPARIEQIVWNLLRNAIKFTPPAGRITLTTRDDPCPATNDGAPPASCILIEISDTGPGIAPEDLARVFQPFEQATTPQQSTGLGLGLAVCRALVNRHHGTITARSDGPGTGASFQVRLPATLVTTPPFSRDPKGSATPATPLTPLNILLVEDDPDSGPLLRRLLQSAGHRVTLAPDAQTALVAAREQFFDLIISDLRLPDRTGHDLLRTLRNDPNIPRPPPRAICLSGSADEADRQASRQAGFDVHLRKPIDPRALNDLIAAPHSFADA